MYLERSRKQFVALWWSCAARKGLFMGRERSRKQFSPLWKSCEASARLLNSLVPRRGGGGERAPGTHCSRMRLIATEFRGDRVCT